MEGLGWEGQFWFFWGLKKSASVSEKYDVLWNSLQFFLSDVFATILIDLFGSTHKQEKQMAIQMENFVDNGGYGSESSSEDEESISILPFEKNTATVNNNGKPSEPNNKEQKQRIRMSTGYENPNPKQKIRERRVKTDPKTAKRWGLGRMMENGALRKRVIKWDQMGFCDTFGRTFLQLI